MLDRISKEKGNVMKGFTIKDATKDDFIRFFTTNVSGISCKPYFERWLFDYRSKQLLDASDNAINESEKAFNKYIECIKKSVAATDLDEKIRWCKEAEKYEKLAKHWDKEYEKINKKLMAD